DLVFCHATQSTQSSHRFVSPIVKLNGTWSIRKAPGSRLKRFQNAAKLNSPLYRVRVENVLKSPVPPSTVEVLCRSAMFPNPLSCARAVPHKARNARNSAVILVILMFFLPVPYANQATHARAVGVQPGRDWS